MLYFANPCGPAVIAAMVDGDLGLIDTPRQRKTTETNEAHEGGAAWCADNGCFSNKWDEEKWWAFLVKNAHRAPSCTFAVAPDVIEDAAATLEKSLPWLARIRELGYPVAYVAQDGQESVALPWDEFDCLFIGGSDDFKLGAYARQLAAQAKARGKWLHMGRVNSERRWRYAKAIGCDSVDGTYLTYGPDVNLPNVLAWNRNNDQGSLWLAHEGN